MNEGQCWIAEHRLRSRLAAAAFISAWRRCNDNTLCTLVACTCRAFAALILLNAVVQIRSTLVFPNAFDMLFPAHSLLFVITDKCARCRSLFRHFQVQALSCCNVWNTGRRTNSYLIASNPLFVRFIKLVWRGSGATKEHDRFCLDVNGAFVPGHRGNKEAAPQSMWLALC